MTRAVLLTLALLAVAPAAVQADGPHAMERANGLSAPREGSTRHRRRRRHRPGPPPVPYVITGPHVEVGYAHYWLPIAHTPGDVNVGTFSGFFNTHDIRAGLTFEGGSRNYHLGNDDVITRGQVFIGWQGLHVAPPFVPWVTGNLGLGVIVGQRLSTTLAFVTWSLGVEVGADVYLVRGVHIGVAVGLGFYAVGDVGYPVVDLRAYFGL